MQTDIYQASAKAAKEYSTHLQAGANIAGFLKVAEAMVGLDSNFSCICTLQYLETLAWPHYPLVYSFRVWRSLALNVCHLWVAGGTGRGVSMVGAASVLDGSQITTIGQQHSRLRAGAECLLHGAAVANFSLTHDGRI